MIRKSRSPGEAVNQPLLVVALGLKLIGLVRHLLMFNLTLDAAVPAQLSVGLGALIHHVGKLVHIPTTFKRKNIQ